MDPDEDKNYKTYGLDTTDGLKTIDGPNMPKKEIDAPSSTEGIRGAASSSASSGGSVWTIAMVVGLLSLIGVAAYFFVGG